MKYYNPGISKVNFFKRNRAQGKRRDNKRTWEEKGQQAQGKRSEGVD